MAVFTKINKIDISKIEGNFKLGKVINYHGIKKGIENTNYYLEFKNKKTVLTIFEKRVNKKDLPFFMKLMHGLSKLKIVCPSPIKNKKGSYLFKIKSKNACLVSFLKGGDKKKLSPSDCMQIGKNVAELHKATKKLNINRKNSLSIKLLHKILNKIDKRINKLSKNLRNNMRLDINKLVKNSDYVYHFAAIADIGEAKKNPYKTLEINLVGTMNILEAAVRSKVERVIYASTMYVYNPYGSFYRASKQSAEIMIEAYSEEHDLEYTILRYGSLYGPRTQDWNGIYKYVKEVVQTEKLKYHGTGKERREYIHVEDAAKLSVRVLSHEYKNKAVIVTGNQVLDSGELIEMIFEIAGIDQDIEYSSEEISKDHYGMTPYRYNPMKAMKIIPDEYIDIGQGILEIVGEVIETDNTN